MEGNSCGETCNTLQRCQNASLTDRLYCTYIRGSQRTMPTIAAAPDANHDTNDTREGSSKRKCCIPDLDDRRYCRYCRALQPLSVFPKGKRRYVCRLHIWQCIKKQHQARVLADAHRKMLFKQWQRCYRDAKIFQHARIDVTQGDLAKLLEPAVCAAPTGDDASADPGLCTAVMPHDPVRTLRCDNAVVVPNRTRRLLLNIHRQHGPKAYTAALARCARMPHDPAHDARVVANKLNMTKM